MKPSCSRRSIPSPESPIAASLIANWPRASEANQEFCVLLFDLDGFKAVNDHFGHLCGDEVLKQVAARLSGQVRARDFVCRWGGDEFVAVLACEQAFAETRSRQIAARLNGALPHHR